MVDITHKTLSLRKAIASARIKLSSENTLKLIQNNQIPKGNIFEFGRAAGLLAIKKTSDIIPDCHPIPIEMAQIRYEMQDLSIYIEVEVHTIYKTGVEVEAMHGASVVALTLYDMLKPVDKGLEIQSIKLELKKGGKTDFRDQKAEGLEVAVIVCSDSISQGKNEDLAGKAVIQKLFQYGIHTPYYQIVPDEVDSIQNIAKKLSQNGTRLILFIGGTGLSPRDITPEAVSPLLEKTIPGIMEVSRAYGQERMPYAMLSRGVAGFIGETLVLTLPGSTKGATESMDALFPYLLHVFKVAEGKRHEE